MSWIWISFSKKSKDLNLIFCTLGECPIQVKGLSMTKLYLDCTLILTKFKIRLKSGWSEVLKIRIDFFHIFPNIYFYLDKIKTKMQLGKFFLSNFFQNTQTGFLRKMGQAPHLKFTWLVDTTGLTTWKAILGWSKESISCGGDCLCLCLFKGILARVRTFSWGLAGSGANP